MFVCTTVNTVTNVGVHVYHYPGPGAEAGLSEDAWAGLGWAGLGWAGLGWAGLGWAGLGWAGLGWEMGWEMGWAGPEGEHAGHLTVSGSATDLK